MLKSFIVSFLVLFDISSADSTNLEQLIGQLKNTQAKDRYIIMNRIKMELVKLNDAQRAAALEKIRQKAKISSSKKQKNPKGLHKHKNRGKFGMHKQNLLQETTIGLQKQQERLKHQTQQDHTNNNNQHVKINQKHKVSARR